MKSSWFCRNASFAAGLLASTCSLAVADVGVSSSDATALITRVATAYTRNARGVVGVHAQSLLTIKAPVFRRRIANNQWFVFVDGKLAQSSQQPDPRRPPLRDPYRAENIGDYTFAYVPCAQCRPGTVAVAFSSRLHDVEHARGRLIIDQASALIVSQTETPYKLPWPTTDGQLDATWGSAGGGWFPLTISGAFVGRIGPFIGHATYAESLSAYGHYPSIQAAADALANASASVAAVR